MHDIYSDLKIFHFASKLKNISNGILTAPIHVRLKPTNKCNHDCYYCCYRNKNLLLNQLFNTRNEIPHHKILEVIENLTEMGTRAVTFTGGGEPLCYPFIDEAVEKLYEAGIKIGILTNGSLLKDKKGKIVGDRATWVRISMDAADKKNYSRTRHVSLNEFDNICDNIYNFSRYKSKKCQLGINYVVSKNNYKDVYKFLKLMRELGVQHVKISELVVSTKQHVNKKYHSYLKNSVKKQVERGLVNLADNNFSIINKFVDFNSKEDCYKKDYTSCPFIHFLTIIAADLNVYVCQDKAYTKDGKIGSIRNKSFRQLWFSNRTKNHLTRLNPSKDCNHHCSQHKKNLMLLHYFNTDKDHLDFV